MSKVKKDKIEFDLSKKRKELFETELLGKVTSAGRIYRKIKALSKPYLGAYIKKDGKKLIIWKVELIE